MSAITGPSTSAVIASNQAEHRELLQRLEATDYASQGLEQARSRVETLNKSIADKTKHLSSIAAKTKKEYDDWQKVQSSTLRRSLLRVKGRDALALRVDKEEQEYLEAFREEIAEKDALKTLQLELQEAQSMILDLDKVVVDHEAIQDKLNNMYERVFAGPSSGFPEEDAAEADVYAVEKEYKTQQAKINGIAQGINLQAKAVEAFSKALIALDDANQSINLPFMFRGSYETSLQQESIQTCIQLLARGQSFYTSAHESDPALGDLDKLGVPDIRKLANQYFDSRLFYYGSYSTMDALASGFTKAGRQLWNAREAAVKQMRASEVRHKQASKQTGTIHLRLRRARLQLDSVRRGIMLEAQVDQALVDEPESMQGTEEQADTNPYAAYLANRVNTLDLPADPTPPPAYRPRQHDYRDLAVS